jgi:hypothetical protein
MKVKILDIAAETFVDANILPVTITDLETVAWDGKRRGRFKHFDWKDIGWHSTEDLLKLEKDGIILGFMKFFHEDLIIKTIELNKIEVSTENYGRDKQYDFIAGCLIAYACLFAQKFNGELYVLSKKVTKQLYIDKYGMKVHDQFYLTSDKSNCRALISKYLKIEI